jgi:hypothetical protein
MEIATSGLYLNFILKIRHWQLHQIKLGVQFKFSKCYLLLLQPRIIEWGENMYQLLNTTRDTNAKYYRGSIPFY